MTTPTNLHELETVNEYYPDNIAGSYPDKNTLPEIGWVGGPAPENAMERHLNVDIDPVLKDSPLLYAVLDENNIVLTTFLENRIKVARELQTNSYHFYLENNIPHPEKSKVGNNYDKDPSKTKILVDDTIQGHPSPGYIYDSENKRFVPPCPLEGYVLNEETFRWEPVDGQQYDIHNTGVMHTWNKSLNGWIIVEEN